MTLAGHFWTVAPALRHLVAPRAVGSSRPWRASVADARLGSVSLTGLLTVVPEAPALLLVVHGLGGRATSGYAARAAAAAARAGVSCLRLHLRGADRLGEDFYHAGLTADLHAALASPEVRSHPSVLVLGYSLGGHLALRLGCEARGTSVRAVAAACPPLDLGAAAEAFDRDVAWPYRRHVLCGLVRAYAAVARRREVPSPLSAVRRVRGVREWDRLTVVPRHGFADVDDYYRRESVAGRLAGLAVPALIVASEADPMVPARVVHDALGPASDVEVRWTPRGGHVGFPGDLDLGFSGPLGLEGQVLTWLLSR